MINKWKVQDLIWIARFRWQDLPRQVVKTYDEGRLLFTYQSIKILTPGGWVECTDEYDYIVIAADGEHVTYERKNK